MKNACGNPTWFRRRFLECRPSCANLNTAYRQVMRNKGAAGKQTRTLSRVRVTQSSS